MGKVKKKRMILYVVKFLLFTYFASFTKSCKEIARSLVDCMKESECMKQGGDFKTCLEQDNSKECQAYRTAYFNCRREQFDMRSRITGPKHY
jgi:hypothetical protein